MNKVFTSIALSISALIATSAIAAPHDHQNNYRYAQQAKWDQKHDHRWNQNNHHDRYERNQRVNPSREWRSGQYLPSQFSSSRYQVNYKNYRHLSKPGKYQQWYKVNGDYVLVNERNNRIIRIIG
ncbi:RcnB family protein [Acinetobacter sp. Marseille-Q1618]|uniref:RcnB family protein n=1 Tax=Acinetobacter sp. Marseille-Q1618 TaxID=2697502 RepID=UPI00156DA317|nr:RcnB family protein [Acinetobacter sp. Marseille-Q1618]